MSRWFDFSDGSFQFSTLDELRRVWQNVPSASARNAIAETHQYYEFITTMIVGRLRSWSAPPEAREPWFVPSALTLSARAGAISSAIVVGAAIVECAMRSHAEHRQIPKLMKRESRHRTFGVVIYEWSRHGVFGRELQPAIEDVTLVKERRNDIHLFSRGDRSWEDVVREEEDLLSRIDRLMLFFQALQPAAPLRN
jgi:hypothetical protein